MKTFSHLIALMLFLFIAAGLQAQSPQNCTPAEIEACKKICSGGAQAGILNYIPAKGETATAKQVSYAAESDVKTNAAQPVNCNPANCVKFPEGCLPGCKPVNCGAAKVKLN